MRKPKQRDFYKEIDVALKSVALKSYEDYKPWHDKNIDWICNRIDWCWRFRHITKEQMRPLL